MIMGDDVCVLVRFMATSRVRDAFDCLQEDTLKEEEDRKHREQERLERLKAEEEAKKRKKRTDHFLNLSTAPV